MVLPRRMASEKNGSVIFTLFLSVSSFLPIRLEPPKGVGSFHIYRIHEELWKSCSVFWSSWSPKPLHCLCDHGVSNLCRTARTWTHIQRFAALLLVRLALGLSPAPVSLALWSSHCEPPAMAPAPNAARAPHRFASGEQSLTIESKSRTPPTAIICLPSLLYIWFASLASQRGDQITQVQENSLSLLLGTLVGHMAPLPATASQLRTDFEHSFPQMRRTGVVWFSEYQRQWFWWKIY